ALPGGRPVTLTADQKRFFLDAVFSPDGKRLATLADPLEGEAVRAPVLELWDTQTGRNVHVTELPDAYAYTLAFQPGERPVAVLMDDRIEKVNVYRSHAWVVVVNAETGRVIRTLAGKPINGALAYSPDGKWLIGPGERKQLNVWDASSGQLARTIDTGE